MPLTLASPPAGDALRFLLSHVKGTLRRLKIDFGHLIADNAEEGSTTRITEEDLETALIESGTDLRHLELCWPYSTRPFLNEVSPKLSLLVLDCPLGPPRLS
jgi:hypothetical protein